MLGDDGSAWWIRSLLPAVEDVEDVEDDEDDVDDADDDVLAVGLVEVVVT